jgi:hypothetical protein
MGKNNTDGTLRRCASCGEWKDQELFKFQSNGFRASYCPPCSSARRKARNARPDVKEKRRVWQERYQATDRCKELWRKNAANVRASRKGRERIAAYYADPEIKRLKSKYHATRNQTDRAKEQRRINQEKYRKSPKGIAVMRTHGHRRRLAKNGSAASDIKVIERWHVGWMAKRSVRCYWCGGKFPPSQCNADHIKPLVSGGTHEIGNLCISCGPCNRRKHAKSLEEWNRRIEQPALL